MTGQGSPFQRRVHDEVGKPNGLILEVRGRNHARLVDPSTGRYVTLSCSPRCPDVAVRQVARSVARWLG